MPIGGFPAEPVELRGIDEILRLMPLGIEVPLAEIYSRR
jgi:hypothetical protein